MPKTSRTSTVLGMLCAASASICPFATGQTPSFSDGVAIGIVSSSDIWEASGLAASAQNLGVLWTHNDSGFPGSALAVSTNGALLGRWAIPGVDTGDFEDIAIGPGPNPALQYIYLGDIGDNDLERPNIHVYRFPEPAVYQASASQPNVAEIIGWDVLTLVYPDGLYNAEGLLVDPVTGDLFIFTKLSDSCRVYSATRAQLESGSPITLNYVTELAFRRVSGVCISPDGSMIVVRREPVGELWLRAPGQSIAAALEGNSTPIPIASEPNGESITFDPVSGGYFTLSEGLSQPINYYSRNNGTVPAPRVLVPPGSSWSYDDFGAAEVEGWAGVSFDDSFFTSGPAPLGYGGGEATTVGFGDPGYKHITTYLRHHFAAPTRSGLSNLALRVCFNDGVAIYLNGQEILRRSLPLGATAETFASRNNSTRRDCWFTVPVDPALLSATGNVLAVELHRADRTGDVLRFDAQLVEAPANAVPAFRTAPAAAGNKVKLSISGPSNYMVRVEQSTDLKTWTAAGQLRLSGSQGVLELPAAGKTGFYRIAE